ncbi:MAG: hypothetical protein IPL49_18220 [Saprospirales bacterium]|nr:hypothetical protein [Saprospirales bacterium]
MDRALPNGQQASIGKPSFIAVDFQQPGAYECPWGNVQLAPLHLQQRREVLDPPRDYRRHWLRFVRAHPGSFTLGCTFHGLTF